MSTDLRHAVRILRQAPGFTLLVVIVLAIGIGATTSIFSVVNGVLLKPLPFPDAGRLIAIQSGLRGDRDGTASVPVAYTGRLPDPFRADREVVVDVVKDGNVFVGQKGSLVTKCPSKFTADQTQT